MDSLMLFSKWEDKIPSDKALILQKRLEELEDSDVAMLSTVPLKSPLVALLLSIFLGGFGFDRFYKGDILLGVLKLMFSWWTFGIWWVIDWFLVYKEIKEDNLQRLFHSMAFFASNKKAPVAQTTLSAPTIVQIQPMMQTQPVGQTQPVVQTQPVGQTKSVVIEQKFLPE